uniref:dTCF n=1 Tax=Plectus sambesii TaxID=2011161 RepID=A0A914XRS9_9BILA
MARGDQLYSDDNNRRPCQRGWRRRSRRFAPSAGQPYSMPFHPASPLPYLPAARLPIPTSSVGGPPPAHNGGSATSASAAYLGALSLDPSGKTGSPTFPFPFSPFVGAANMSPTYDMCYGRSFFTPHSPANLSPMHSPAGTPIMPKHAQDMLKNNNSFGIPLNATFQQHMNMMRLASNSSSANPLTSINQMRLPQMTSPITSMANSLAAQQANQRNGLSDSRSQRAQTAAERRKDNHIKKPLNAFMWFMKENRPRLMEEQGYKERQSAELNKELGRRWHDLPQDEQQKYYAMAREERAKHMQKYPGWTARDNYAINKKKKRKRDKSLDNSELKKCRARFGLDNQAQWCKHCKRKKRCLVFREGGKASPEEHSPPAHVTSTTQGSPAVVVEPVNGSASHDDVKKVKLESRSDNAPNGVDTAHTSPSSSSGTSRVTSSTSRNPTSDDHDSGPSDDDDDDDDDDDMNGISDDDEDAVDGIDRSEAAAALAMAVDTPTPLSASTPAVVPARN